MTKLGSDATDAIRTGMTGRQHIEDAIAALIAEEKAYDVASVCDRYGLAPAGDDDPMRSKRKYVEARLRLVSGETLRVLGERLATDYAESEPLRSADLFETLRMASSRPRISEVTRRELANALDRAPTDGGLGGKRGMDEVLIRADAALGRSKADVWQHTVRNFDWACEYLFEHAQLLRCSDTRFLRVLEEMVHPLSRKGAEQLGWVRAINEHVARDGFSLVATEEVSGYPIYRASPARSGVDGRLKNLIFASTGPKPEIVLDDALNNDLRIVSNEDLILIYDEPFPGGALTWQQLVAWWTRRQALPDADRAAERSLYRRLHAAVKASNSPPEEVLFKAYYALRSSLGDGIPALLPQVYLHFDPEIARRRTALPPFVRQRMDFLMLLPDRTRIVIEVDGVQHYSEGGRPSPAKYGTMLAEDRRLRLLGYEVYRFGGSELQGEAGTTLATSFFTQLLKRQDATSTDPA